MIEPTAEELVEVFQKEFDEHMKKELRGCCYFGIGDIQQAYNTLKKEKNKNVVEAQIRTPPLKIFDQPFPNSLVVAESYKIERNVTEYYVFFTRADGTLYSLAQPRFMEIAPGAEMPLVLSKVGK